jgi:signal transduction histidine kinase
MQIWLFFIVAVANLAALIVVIYDRYSTKKTLKRIDAMLDEAMKGDFSESAWDESMLSSVEAKLSRYLKSSAGSARNLREQKAKIEALVADISHQTKTPIANILLYAQLLDEQDLPENARLLAASLVGQSEKLKTLIEALVKTSRLETGIFQFQPKCSNVKPMLEETIGQYFPKAQQKHITLTLEPGDGYAVFDAKWTTEAVGNLIDNAIKYTPAGGSISLQISEYDMFCRIDVADNGAGIPEDEQAKIFQRFYRSPSVAEEEGVGLGLYLARQIITGQGGYIKLASQPEKGSVFSIFLPRE